MRLTTIRPVIVGVASAALVIALTGAVSGNGVGAVFNLGKANSVNASSTLTGKASHSMLSVTNTGTGPALSLQVAKGKAPLTVNSSTKVANLNASLLGGLSASQFVHGGGTTRAFGMAVPTATDSTTSVLSLNGFGSLSLTCGPAGGGSADLDFLTRSHPVDRLVGAAISNGTTVVGDTVMSPHMNFGVNTVSGNGVSGVSENVMLRYKTGSGSALTTHLATVTIILDVANGNCDIDISATIARPATG